MEPRQCLPKTVVKIRDREKEAPNPKGRLPCDGLAQTLSGCVTDDASGSAPVTSSDSISPTLSTKEIYHVFRHGLLISIKYFMPQFSRQA
eukprot:scaffold205823_cov36-Tisochrysis_lutea.AAC.3